MTVINRSFLVSLVASAAIAIVMSPVALATNGSQHSKTSTSADSDCFGGGTSKLKTPESPDRPKTPEKPKTPQTPKTPDVPKNPETPEAPVVPTTPVKPATPIAPAPALPQTGMESALSGALGLTAIGYSARVYLLSRK